MAEENPFDGGFDVSPGDNGSLIVRVGAAQNSHRIGADGMLGFTNAVDFMAWISGHAETYTRSLIGARKTLAAIKDAEGKPVVRLCGADTAIDPVDHLHLVRESVGRG